MSLLFVEHDLLLPTFVILHDQFLRRVLVRIDKAGHQAMDFIMTGSPGIIQLVFDHADDDALAVIFPMPVARINLRQERPVFEITDRSEYHRLLDPHQQMMRFVQ